MINRNKINTLFVALAVFSLGLPSIVRAVDIASYTLEQGIPFIGGADQTLSYGEFSTLFQKFITAVYIIAAVAAFIKIFLSGIRWYTSGGSSKAISQAREDIKNALMGLAFLFLAGTLLVFINPNLNKLSKIFNPNGGTQCVQGGDSTNGGNTGNGANTLTKIGNTRYYAMDQLTNALAASKLNFTITTGCTSTNQISCNPNYCTPEGCETKEECLIANIKSNTCSPILQVACHFNGSCVDLIVANGNYDSAIQKLNAAGLEILNESGTECGDKKINSNDHLHVALPGNITTRGECFSKYEYNPNP